MAQDCNLAALTAGGAPFRALSPDELNAIQIMLKAKALNAQDGAISASLDALKIASAHFVQLPANQKQQIRTYLFCQAAVAAGASEDCDDPADLIEEAKLWAHTSPDELAAIRLYLDCQEVDIGGATL